LPTEVRLYTPSTIGALGPYIDLVITPGTQAAATFPDCTGFTPDAGGAVFTNTLTNFAATHNTFLNGIEFNPGGGANWAAGTEVVYQFQVTLNSGAPVGAQGQSTGTHAYEWQAQS
ncbi:MAG: hypothetical protein M3M99_01685, partial [Actinomycetota bacterium]|nr:hypothetical protein [Actinomycetota bacterium]